MGRNISLQAFLSALETALLARTASGTEAGEVARQIFARLKTPADRVGGMAAEVAPTEPLPAHRFLDAALAKGRERAADLAAVSDSFAALQPHLAWQRRKTDAAGRAYDDEDNFVRGHANAYLVGPGGLERRPDVLVGVSLMAPGIQYVDHHHPPAEVYLVLTPGYWRQEQEPWWEPGVGGIVYNQPDVLHAMKSADTPLFAAWCLLVEDAAAA